MNPAQHISPFSLDIPGRIVQGTSFLGRSLDPDYHIPNILMINDGRQAWHCHDFADFGDLTSRYLEALVLAEAIAGIKPEGQARMQLEDHFFSYFGADGLSYRPETGAPWVSHTSKRPYEPNIAEGFDQSRVMYALLALHRQEGDPRARDRIERFIHGLRARAVFKDNTMYFASPLFRKGAAATPSSALPYPQQLYFAQTLIHPLVTWWECSGDTLAIETAQQLARFVTKDQVYFGTDGSFQSLQTPAPGSWDLINGHTHSRLGSIAGLIKLGRALADADMLAFGKRAFDWFYSNYCLACGWCPEFIGRYPMEQEGCETCTLMDLIICCLELVSAGYANYWNVIERLVRNQLVEQQLLDERFIPAQTVHARSEFAAYPIGFEAIRGGFGGWCGVNDFVGPNVSSHMMMHCCGPSGVKALCLAWQNAVTLSGNVLQINLLIPHQSSYAVVVPPEQDSLNAGLPKPLSVSAGKRAARALPGRLDITARVCADLNIRMPDWVARDHVRLFINEHSAAVAWHGDYVIAGRVEPGSRVRLEYPVRETILTERVGAVSYKTCWQGDTVISISPAGKHIPLYQR